MDYVEIYESRFWFPLKLISEKFVGHNLGTQSLVPGNAEGFVEINLAIPSLLPEGISRRMARLLKC